MGQWPCLHEEQVCPHSISMHASFRIMVGIKHGSCKISSSCCQPYGGGDAFLIPGVARRVPGAPCLQHGLLLPTFLIMKLYSLINIIAVSGMLIVYGFGIIIG